MTIIASSLNYITWMKLKRSSERSFQTAMQATLAEYEHHPVGSWKRALFEMRKEILALAELSNDVVLDSLKPVQLVEFTHQCDLWNKKVFLGAAVRTSG